MQETSAGRNKLLAEVFLNIKATVMLTTAMVRKTAKRAITVFFFKIRLPLPSVLHGSAVSVKTVLLRGCFAEFYCIVIAFFDRYRL